MTTRLSRLVLPLLLFLAWTPVARAWSWPVRGPVLQPFSYDQARPYAAGQHRGVDIGADAAGELVAAPAAGTVSFAGTVPTSGKSVTIETADGYSVTLTHLGSLGVVKGLRVAEGDAIGAVGPSGTPEEDVPYVHLGIRVATDPNGYVDPLGLLPSPPAESPPAPGDAAVSQPSASTGAAAPASPAATEPAAPAASAPTASATSTRPATGSTARSDVSHRRHDRACTPTPRVEQRHHRSGQRPAAQPARSTGRIQHGRLRKPTSSSRRPVVETAAPAEPAGLPADHESRPGAAVAQPRREPPGRVPSALVCNGAMAVFALGLALAAYRRRRSANTRPVGAQVLDLPPPSVGRRHVSRAA